MKTNKIYLLALLFTVVYGCKVPYQPSLNNPTTNYLVVDGVINNANGSTDSTFIRLSRTAKLTTINPIVPELHDQVSVEDGQGFTVALKETTNGYYVSGPLGLDSKKPYRLRIKAANGETYLSDLVTPVYTPPIDSIGFTINGDQATIYANAHNPANNTRYYRWDYTEAWEVVPVTSDFMTNGFAIVARDSAHQYPKQCWQQGASTNIILSSTAKLANDVVYQAPLTYINGTASNRLSFRYSMLLKQYGLTQDAYTFWSQEQKNTEQLGTIFDAQPSQINGNIHSVTDPTEPVFGYVSVTNVQTKRVYISRTSLPNTFLAGVYCPITPIYEYNPTTSALPPDLPDAEKVPPTILTELIPLGSQLIPLTQTFAYPVDQTVTPSVTYTDPGYNSTTIECVDCSLGGTTTKPYFWTGP